MDIVKKVESSELFEFHYYAFSAIFIRFSSYRHAYQGQVPDQNPKYTAYGKNLKILVMAQTSETVLSLRAKFLC